MTMTEHEPPLRPARFFVGPEGRCEVRFGGAWAELLPALVAERGWRRVLVLASASRRARARAEAIAAALGDRCVGHFDEAAQHVPRALAERATAELRRRDADAIVAVGGGSVIGLAKAVALLRSQAGEPRPGLLFLPTTYAGSEMTAIWGIEKSTGPGKQVGRDEAVRADAVIYDPALSATLPVKLAIPSLFNAMAHAVDALFPLEDGSANEAEAIAELAEAAIAELAEAIATLADAPEDRDARLRALSGSQRAGEILDRAGMSLHHKLAHVLGGRFGLAHAPTHTALLAQVLAFMTREGAAPRALARLRGALASAGLLADDGDPAAALFDLQVRVDAPRDLLALGLDRAGVEQALAEVLDAREHIASPRPLGEDELRELILDAWLGRRPSLDARRLPAPALEHRSHAGLRPALAGAPLDEARAVVLCVHGRGSTAEAMIGKLAKLLGGLPEGLAVVAVQASARSWYPHGFAEPLARNQPDLDGALELLAAVRERLPGPRTLLFGFSQGACLVLEQLARDGGPTAGVVAIAGALIGERAVGPQHRARLDGARVVVGVAERDRWVPRDRVEASADQLEAQGARLRRIFTAGDAHTISSEQGAALRELVAAALTPS